MKYVVRLTRKELANMGSDALCGKALLKAWETDDVLNAGDVVVFECPKTTKVCLSSMLRDVLKLTAEGIKVEIAEYVQEEQIPSL
jgi:hypothetical protein